MTGGLIEGNIMGDKMKNAVGVVVLNRFGKSIIRCAPTSMGGVTLIAKDPDFKVVKGVRPLIVPDVFEQLVEMWPRVAMLCAEAYRHACIVDTPMFYRNTPQGPHTVEDVDYLVRVQDFKSDRVLLSFTVKHARLYDLFSAEMTNLRPDFGVTAAWLKSIVSAGHTLSKASEVYLGRS